MMLLFEHGRQSPIGDSLGLAEAQASHSYDHCSVVTLTQSDYLT